MEEFNWQQEIEEWVSTKKRISPYKNSLQAFFKKTFKHTSFPERALFGAEKTSLSLLTGQIYFAACSSTGEIWMLLDRKFSNLSESNFRIVKSTKEFNHPLFWFNSRNLENLDRLTANPEVWISFNNATARIIENKKVTAYRESIAKNKVPVNVFFFEEKPYYRILEERIEQEIEMAKNLTSAQHRKKINQRSDLPEKILVTQYVFIRNPYVIAEVLERAGGKCERCLEPAPFIRDKDASPYLEVHHKIPLAEDGPDSLANTIALCPNCHRQAHFGKSTY